MKLQNFFLLSIALLISINFNCAKHVINEEVTVKIIPPKQLSKPKRVIKKVLPGIDVLLNEKIDLIKGKRVGLITNPTGICVDMKTNVDKLFEHPDVELVALFGPEHGVRGNVTAGEKVEDAIDQKTGVKMLSLYGKNRRPSPEMLENIDVLIYDIQDIGSRAYTYIYTMAFAMQAAAENNIPFIVLDRPNPLGGNLIDGGILDTKFRSFVGYYPIPFVYGLTCGELAQLFNQEYNINADLTIITMDGWKRDMTFEDTGLEWVISSPHIPNSDASFFCAATGILGELHSVNIGIGYTLPFEVIGQEWIDCDEFAEYLNSKKLEGVYFRPLYYTPYYHEQVKKHLQGVQIHITDKSKFKPMEIYIHTICAIHKLYPEQDIFNKKRIKMFDRVNGTDNIRKDVLAGKSPEQIISEYQDDIKKFKELSKQYYLYE